MTREGNPYNTMCSSLPEARACFKCCQIQIFVSQVQKHHAAQIITHNYHFIYTLFRQSEAAHNR